MSSDGLAMSTLVDFGGHTHAVNPIGGSEHTLCGMAQDAFASERCPDLQWEPPRHSFVTCPECVTVVRLCKSLRLGPLVPRPQ